jgi:hypothetical protein
MGDGRGVSVDSNEDIEAWLGEAVLFSVDFCVACDLL